MADKEILMTDEEYAEIGGVRCPHCRSYDITACDAIRTNEFGDAFQEVGCGACGFLFTDVYRLVGYNETHI